MNRHPYAITPTVKDKTTNNPSRNGKVIDLVKALEEEKNDEMNEEKKAYQKRLKQTEKNISSVMRMLN